VLDHGEPLWTRAAPDALGHAADDVPEIFTFVGGWNPDEQLKDRRDLASAHANWLVENEGLTMGEAQLFVMGEFPAKFQTKATGMAVVLFPGGGYSSLETNTEGMQPARWLNARGISAFVVKYRLGARYKHPAMLHDAQRAVRWVRNNAGRLGLDKNRIGVWGFSAGGHLASTVATRYAEPGLAGDEIDRESARPDFCILAYPVITMTEPHTHKWSRQMSLGSASPPALVVDDLSSEKHVTRQTPPTFIFHCRPDKIVSYHNSELFNAACERLGVKSEIHLCNAGDHGVGLAQNWRGDVRDWTNHLDGWLQKWIARSRGLDMEQASDEPKAGREQSGEQRLTNRKRIWNICC
jgi:acetyl esterase/lipase